MVPGRVGESFRLPHEWADEDPFEWDTKAIGIAPFVFTGLALEIFGLCAHRKHSFPSEKLDIPQEWHLRFCVR